jgi:2-polyprenyl-3-methyl-5-hydroxy-6-metoxy-1,4-benzoquinol methylase
MEPNDKYEPRALKWTPQHVKRFWEFTASNPAHRNLYFSRMAGDALIGFVRSHRVKLTGRILDFGCGLGFLLEKLLARGIACEGVDSSEASLQEARRLLGDNPFLRGLTHVPALPAPLPDDSFDVVFMLELVEHVLDEELDKLAGEMRRIIKPGGAVIISTPNQEDMKLEETICPECGCMFHRWQHMRSWSAEALTDWARRAGFRPEVCRAVHLPRPGLAGRLGVMAARVFGFKPPNLVYIGRKEGE